MSSKYKYRILDDISIEFSGYSHDDPLLVCIYDVLKSIGVTPISLVEVWKLEELKKIENSKYGKIKIVKNLWGDIIILPIGNHNLINILDKLFEKSSLFYKKL